MNSKDLELIDRLSKELVPTKGADNLTLFLLKGSVLLLGIAFLAWASLPLRNDFHHQASNSVFAVETALWLCTGILSAIAAYRHSLPGLPTFLFDLLAGLSALVLFLNIPWGGPHNQTTFLEELSLIKGVCGGIISLISVMLAIFFFRWSQRQAPTSTYQTGFLIALSTSSLAAVFMQFVCSQDSSMHMYLWHVTPTLLLAILGSAFAGKILRW